MAKSLKGAGRAVLLGLTVGTAAVCTAAGAAVPAGLDAAQWQQSGMPSVFRSPGFHAGSNPFAAPASIENRLHAPQGSFSFTLDFQPNGDAIEVDAPTDIAFSHDGQYVIVAATGKSPGRGMLSVYLATDLSPVRTIPLTHAFIPSVVLMAFHTSCTGANISILNVDVLMCCNYELFVFA